MSRVWKLAVPLVVVLAVGGYAASSLAASDLDRVTPRQTIVIDESAALPHDDDRARAEKKGDDRGDDGPTSDDDRVVPADVDDLDDAGDEDDD